MQTSSIHEGNHIRWDGSKRPFYEIYYLKFVDPNLEWSFWARYTLLIPQKNTDPTTASVWGIFHHREKGPLALKSTYNLSETDVFHRSSYLHMDQSFISLESAAGQLQHQDHRIQWQLDFEDPTLSLKLYPSLFYRLRFPKTKFLEPRLSTFVSGNLVIDKDRYAFEHIPAHQAHLWGTHYATRWVWGNCTTFREDPTAVFEGLVAEVPLNFMESPPMALFVFIWQGKEYRCNGPLKWFRNRSQHNLHSWSFEAISRDTKFVGHLRRSTEQIAGVTYHGPNDELRYCHSSMMADMRLDIFKKERHQWIPVTTLNAPQCAAFETVEPVPEQSIPFVL